MNPKERVLGPNGFESFPERLREKAIEQGNMQRPADAGDASAHDLPDNGAKGKAEIAKNQAEAAREQKQLEKDMREQKKLKE